MKTHEDNTYYTVDELIAQKNINTPWYERVWYFVYYPVYRFFYWGIWDHIKPSNFKHWYQRARYGYSYRDCWSIDWYLADIIPKMINQLKGNLHGVPSDIADKYVAEDKHDIDMTHATAEWESILDKIVNTFKLEHEILDCTLYDCKNKKEENKMKELMKEECWDDGCRIMTKKEKTSRDEGWKLLREHFGNLWD